MTNRGRRWAKLLAGLLVTGVCSWLVIQQVDLPQIWFVLSSADPSWVFLGLSFLSTAYLLRIVRWWLMLRTIAPTLPLTACAGPFLSGIALNNVLPFRAGDIMRVVGFCRQLTLPASSVFGSLVLERLLDLTAILIVFFVALPRATPDGFPADILAAAGWLAVACVMLVVLIIAMPEALARLAENIAAVVHRWTWGRIGHVAHWMVRFFSSLALMRTRQQIIPLVLLSLGAWCLEGALFAAVAKGLQVGQAGLAPWFALSMGTLGTLLPSTPGYLGTFDYLMMVGFLAYGFSKSVAATCALLIHVVLWIPQTTVGMAWFLVIKLRRAAPAMDSHSSVRASA
ncbi:MAG TPA: lysylphosphatidylglycerol synthase transmembrane domain-containing protein [Nitrospiraceae bacterium]|nr:lysylphosphatidylglycerol synthase transmembrane domain-containing protein [Nitrospiraceae bacterium]